MLDHAVRNALLERPGWPRSPPSGTQAPWQAATPNAAAP